MGLVKCSLLFHTAHAYQRVLGSQNVCLIWTSHVNDLMSSVRSKDCLFWDFYVQPAITSPCQLASSCHWLPLTLGLLVMSRLTLPLASFTTSHLVCSIIFRILIWFCNASTVFPLSFSLSFTPLSIFFSLTHARFASHFLSYTLSQPWFETHSPTALHIDAHCTGEHRLGFLYWTLPPHEILCSNIFWRTPVSQGLWNHSNPFHLRPFLTVPLSVHVCHLSSVSLFLCTVTVRQFHLCLIF